MGIFVDLLLFLFFTKIGGRVNGSRDDNERRGSDIFIPFEDQCSSDRQNVSHQDKTDYYPEDFSDFGEF